MSKPNVLFWDIETTNLRADMGTILCVAWKWLGEKTVNSVMLPDYPSWDKDPTNDKALVKDFSKVLLEADLIVAHYGDRFDFKFVQSKLLKHGLPPIPRIKSVDTWKIARNNLLLQSNRMDNIAAFFEVNRKTRLPKAVWQKCNMGHVPSIKKLMDYCKQDVRVLEDVYLKIRSVDATHPNLNLVEIDTDGKPRCPVCMSKCQRRGQRPAIAQTMVYWRYQCVNKTCGKWSRGKNFRPDKDHPIEVR